MKLSHKSWLIVAVMACFSLLPTAFGQTVNLQFTGGTGADYGNEDTSPYQFKINGSSSTVSLICDAFLNQITANETWTAQTNTVTSAATSGLFKGAAAAAGYKEVATLAIALLEGQTPVALSSTGLHATPASESDIISFAIWDVFDPGTGSGQSLQSLSTNDRYWVNQVLNWATLQTNYSANGVGLANVVIYTPNPGSESDKSLGTPQEFVGIAAQTPEPSSPAILGADLLALGVLVLYLRRRAPRVAQALQPAGR